MPADHSGLPARVKAVLGPTNTGKTHLAMERMLAHASGMIGFPLRLLARENYDRMVAQKGARHVALITGEEKIVPPGARWFACTVEAMPLDRAVEFLAVDEIQLCADPDRGHIFTERLLHARGLVETMFLGAETIRPLLQRLVPGAEAITRPRLSQLVHAGPAKLMRLPPRSAVVAFSAAEVYAIAEAIRRRRGGCAVVMGRLSPRTRNAQVALYQNKEVDYLVATDAIGMGLNMDVDHVAFAGLRKFDGRQPRPLQPAEVAQIAGRAGRGMRDGTFGTTADCPPMAQEVVEAVEAHVFDTLEQIVWRNADLDFTNPDALLASLNAAPPRRGLVRGPDAVDVQTLLALSREGAVRDRARGVRMTRLLWECCGIPDFRKLADDSHMRFCGKVFGHLAGEGTVPTDWVAGQIAALARIDGDIDTLMARLSGVRVWSYIAAHPDWLRDAAQWQERARAVEDMVSDALHASLTARFVDRRAAHLIRKLEADSDGTLLSAITARGEVVVEGHPVGRIGGFEFLPDVSGLESDRPLVLRAARRVLQGEMPRRVAALESAADAAFTWRDDQRLEWNGAAVARLARGAEMLAPRIVVVNNEFLDGAQRERIRARLQRFVAAQIETALAPLWQAQCRAAADPALRGVLHRLREGAGLVPGGTSGSIQPEIRAALKRIGVRAGRFALFIPPLLKPRPQAMRARLWALWHQQPLPVLPDPGRISIPCADARASLAALGWIAAGPVWLRLDIAEMMAAELTHLARKTPVPLPPGLAGRLQIGADRVPAVVQALGLRVLPSKPDPALIGPPAPVLLALGRQPKRPMPVRAPVVRPDSPFAILASLPM